MINFKPHSRKDIPHRVRWLNDPSASIFTDNQGGKSTDISEQREWFDRYKKDKNKIFFTIYDNVHPIGFMGLSNIDHSKGEANLFIMIGESGYRGKGIGKMSLQYLIKYAAEKLKLRRVSLEVLKANAPALHLYKNLGFITEKESGKEYFMSLEI